MIETITNINSAVNGIVWGVPAMVLILGVGLYFTLRSKGIQFRKLGLSCKNLLGALFDRNAERKESTMSPFQAICVALGGTVGTGNIAGVAGAIALGGPGAVFWMWISALLGMGTKFAEVTLAIKYREVGAGGEYHGGPMYYIKNGLGKHWHWLAYLFAGFGLLAVFGIGNATQVNSICSSINTALVTLGVTDESSNGTVSLVIGIVIAILILIILIGGTTRIGSVADKLVPFMVILYLVLGLGVIILNISKLPHVIAIIFEGAFNPSSVTGGVVGSAFISAQRGIARGIFSNEAGLGSGPIAHATADVEHPIKQGLMGIFEVFVDTILVCSMTGFIILLAAEDSITYGQAAGAELTITGYVNTYGGWSSALLALSLCCFAFTTILGWGLYGTRFLGFFVKSKAAANVYIVLFAIVAVIGAVGDLGLVWSISDTLNGLMAIPNLIAVFLLVPVVCNLINDFFGKKDEPKIEE